MVLILKLRGLMQRSIAFITEAAMFRTRLTAQELSERRAGH